ncbi:LLM class F420-dependent oxidoreductase [Planosporangium thailandense]|uniref:LLM class F420-dependent oxidoreductase n=1 Tax=Planosporangium thailandense TaxID=765197 RepID=A0ABX0Y4G1_9ACTN|nr:LLM class F420-dependent oxidoreductase [Planosporangium thailandense]NJC73290.1 LLM class F420-dependent oxidoreductase [Planosporangium thailandense]
MRIGVVFPQTEIGPDPDAIRAYATAVQDLGFRHILAYEHVVGADPEHYAGWTGPYDVRTQFHEPMVLFGYLAAFTSLELVNGILVLPQRQTVLAAKQAAEVDILTRGRYRLGVGVGWNPVEYEALGQEFSLRGRRIEQQIELLRRLWTEPVVNYVGAFDRITAAGLAPQPVQRPIPIWMGADSPPAFRRAGRLADGWFPQMPPGPRLIDAKGIVDDAAREAGRDPDRIGMEGRISYGPRGSIGVVEEAAEWERMGATHVCINTMGAGLGGVDDHIAALTAVSTHIRRLARAPG